MPKCPSCEAEYETEESKYRAGKEKIAKKFGTLCDDCIERIFFKAESKLESKAEEGKMSQSSGGAVSASVHCDPTCKACGVVMVNKGATYAHAVIPQSLIKKTDTIFLRFLALMSVPDDVPCDPKGLLVPMPVLREGAVERLAQMEKEIEHSMRHLTQEHALVAYKRFTAMIEGFLQKEIIWELQAVEGCENIGRFPYNPNSLTVPGFSQLNSVVGSSSLVRFGISSQCGDCEKRHGDGSMIERCDNLVSGKEGPDHVGKAYLKYFKPQLIRGWVWDWLTNGFPAELIGTSNNAAVAEDTMKRVRALKSHSAMMLAAYEPLFKLYHKLQIMALAEGHDLISDGLSALCARRNLALDAVAKHYAPPETPDQDEDSDSDTGFGIFG